MHSTNPFGQFGFGDPMWQTLNTDCVVDDWDVDQTVMSKWGSKHQLMEMEVDRSIDWSIDQSIDWMNERTNERMNNVTLILMTFAHTQWELPTHIHVIHASSHYIFV